MQIKVEYPQVMKMFITSTLEMKDTSTIKEIKKEVFTDFWEKFGRHFPGRTALHGRAQDITLTDGTIEITQNEMLKGKTIVYAYFHKHGL